jgi:hypothetical protein
MRWSFASILRSIDLQCNQGSVEALQALIVSVLPLKGVQDYHERSEVFCISGQKLVSDRPTPKFEQIA